MFRYRQGRNELLATYDVSCIKCMSNPVYDNSNSSKYMENHEWEMFGLSTTKGNEACACKLEENAIKRRLY